MKSLSSPTGLIKESFNIFFKKENLVFFLKIYAPLVPFAIFFYFQDSYINKFTQNLDISNISNVFSTLGWLPVLSLVIGLGFLIISFWTSAAGIKGVAEIVGGGQRDVRTTYQFAWRKLWIFSLLSIVVGFLVGLGFLLLIIPGIILMVWYHFSAYELLTKDVGVRAAMGGSKHLVSGRFWPVFGRIIVFGLFGILVKIFFGIFPSGLGSIIQPLSGPLIILPYFLLYRELSA